MPTLFKAVQDEIPPIHRYLHLMSLLYSSTDPRGKDCIRL